MSTKGPLPPTLEEQEAAFHAICYDTLTLGDEAFVHQNVVDAFAAQAWQPDQKPIKLCFALAGLFLSVEHGFTGKRVQRVHVEMAARKQRWPDFVVPIERGSMTAIEVLAAPKGSLREAAIGEWCRQVWDAYSSNSEMLRWLLRDYGYVLESRDK